MALPELSIRQFIDVGAHFGHATRRWNPKMAPYIYGERDGIHIINLDITLQLLRRALQVIHDCVAGGGCVLFVGTKRQAQSSIKESAVRSGQYYINYRWMGGTLTNWNTITKSIARLKELRNILLQPNTGLTKRELLSLERKQLKLDRALGGISEINGMPDLMFVIDSQREALAITEAKRKGIPVIAIVDTNADPDLVDYPISANDDAMRAIVLYCNLVSETILEGVRSQLQHSKTDIGAQKNPMTEKTASKFNKSTKQNKKSSSDNSQSNSQDDDSVVSESINEKTIEEKLTETNDTSSSVEQKPTVNKAPIDEGK